METEDTAFAIEWLQVAYVLVFHQMTRKLYDQLTSHARQRFPGFEKNPWTSPPSTPTRTCNAPSKPYRMAV